MGKRNRMKYIILLFLLVACEQTPTYMDKDIENYCKPCGGVKSAFYNKYGLSIICHDDFRLDMEYKTEYTRIYLGVCKK